MIRPQSLDDLARKISENLPESVRGFQAETERHIKSALHSGLDRMEVVTREDFEIQVALVQRLVDQVTRLEARVADLEARGTDPIRQANAPASD